MNEPISTLLWRARQNAGLKQTEAAIASGVSLTHIAGIEQGKHNPSLDVLHKLAAVYGYKVEIALVKEGR
jgi:transcriptional regulator with XRE-family HTH domain